MRSVLKNRWWNMKQRCYNKNNPGYKNYGGRGIKICDEWLNNFDLFKKWSLANGFKEELTIDRIYNDGDYEPNNCRWTTLKVQANNKRNNHYIEIDGISKTLMEWSEHYKIEYDLVLNRINNLNWNIRKALKTPVNDWKTTYIVDGIEMTVKEICKYKSIIMPTLCSRLDKGLTIEEAIAMKIIAKNEYTTKDGFTGNLRSISKHYSIPKSSLWTKVTKDNIDIDDAIEYLLKNRNKNNSRVTRYSVNNEYLTVPEINRKYNVSLTKLYAGLSKGKTIVELIGKSTNKNHLMFEYEGEWLNLADIARKAGIKDSTLRDRVVYRKMSLEEAISKPIKQVNNHVIKNENGDLVKASKYCKKNNINPRHYYEGIRKGLSLEDAVKFAIEKQEKLK